MPEHCYRHPKRETAVSCSNCGRPICTECMTPTPVGMRCPECARQRTSVRAGAAALSAVGTPIATYALIAINLLVFVAELAGGGGAGSFSGGGTLINDGGLFGPAIDQNGEWYRIVTSGFLHAGPLHVALNMYFLYIIGTLLEPGIGSVRFAALYFVSLLGGAFGALLLDPDQVTVGASGAIFGMLAAAILIARGRGMEQIASQLGFWLLLNVVLTLSIPGISIGGHFGGIVAGGLGALLVLTAERRAGGREAVAIETVGLLAIAAICFAGSLWAAGQGGGGVFG